MRSGLRIAVVLELSSFQNVVSPPGDSRCRTSAVITKFLAEPLDWHGQHGRIRRCQADLCFERQRPDDLAVLNTVR